MHQSTNLYLKNPNSKSSNLKNKFHSTQKKLKTPMKLYLRTS